jgi:hypothetical protein
VPVLAVPVQDSIDSSAQPDALAIEGLDRLWAQTLGDPAICIAILDGPIDLGHPGFQDAKLTQVESLVPARPGSDAAGEHGTHIASVIFGSHDRPVPGLAPRCRGVSIPIFASSGAGEFQVCSQLDLARAINLALAHGAHVINISGGEFAPSADAYPLLANIIRQCAEANVLIVAAAGNHGCQCLQIPAALDSVLAVGGMDDAGEPLEFSNWGRPYQDHGILAPAANVPGALPGGGVTARSGTSYATPIVSGVAALLLCLQRRLGQRPDPAYVRHALLRTAIDCSAQPVQDCRGLLAGRLNIPGALSLITRSTATMDQPPLTPTGITPDHVEPALSETAVIDVARQPQRAISREPAERTEPAPATCGLRAAPVSPGFVYALGQVGYDLMTEARCDSLVQRIAGLNGDVPHRGLAFDHHHMLGYLEKNPWDAASIEWTLSQDGTPIYAVRPQGPFAAQAYEYLREFVAEQEKHQIERISVPGTLSGKARLLNGQVVPTIVPEIRGMYSWTTAAIVDAVVGRPAAKDGRQERERKAAGVHNFLHRVYHEVRNLGMLPQERAINFIATNAFEVGVVYEQAIKDHMELDAINVVRSPICRPESDCWDVELSFFYPERQVQTVRRVYRFTVDVSDVVPVTIGTMRSWFAR